MTQVHIRSVWFQEALQDPKLQAAIRRLRLKNGDFAAQEKLAPEQKKTHTRMFFAVGPRGGIRGILLASRRKEQEPIELGVFVDRKSRRKKIGTNLVRAARDHYPNSVFSTSGWNDPSIGFWTMLHSITGDLPEDYR